MIDRTKSQSPHFIYGMVAAFSRFEKTLGTQATLIEDQTNQTFDKIKKIEKEKSEKIDELSLSVASGKKWGTISSITEGVLALGAWGYGAYLVKEKGADTTSVLCLAAGATSIANRVLKATGAYSGISSWFNGSSTPEENLASSLETGMSWISRGLGVASGLASLSTGAATSAASTALNIASKLTEGCFNIKTASIESEASHIRATIQEKKDAISFLLQNTNQTGKDAEAIAHTMEGVSGSMKDIVETLNTNR